MKSRYRGYEINVTREQCLGGWDLLYYSVFRAKDGWCALDSFSDSDHTVREMIGHLKERIDAELLEDDPWMEKEK